MRILTITRLYPNRVEPLAAAFNRQEVEALSELADVEVLAVIPWFPGARALSRWSRVGRLASVPKEENIGGLRIRHPRVFYVPKLHAAGPALFAASLLPIVLPYRGQVDAVFAPWAFPDGCAAASLARMLGVPCVVKVLGSDINASGARVASRWILRRTLPQCERVVAVSRPLADKVIGLGVPSDQVRVVLDGVDGGLFKPRDRNDARRRLGLHGDHPTIVFVGHLVEAKGVFDLLDAFGRATKTLPDARLVFVGDGPARPRLEARAGAYGSAVTVAGGRPHDEIPWWMAASNVVALASWSEGTPNVLLEALRCGRRVVATDVGGIPDLVHNATRGIVVPARDIDMLAEGLVTGLSNDYDPETVASDMGIRGWDECAREMLQIIEEVVRAS